MDTATAPNFEYDSPHPAAVHRIRFKPRIAYAKREPEPKRDEAAGRKQRPPVLVIERLDGKPLLSVSRREEDRE